MAGATTADENAVCRCGRTSSLFLVLASPSPGWIAELVEHGLRRPSFVPPPEIRVLRDFTRYRKTQIREQAKELQRLENVHAVLVTQILAHLAFLERSIATLSGEIEELIDPFGWARERLMTIPGGGPTHR